MDIDIENVRFEGETEGYSFRANIWMLLVRKAAERGCSFEDLCDGFGEGEGSHGDWSGIRDSSPEAWSKMAERALKHFELT